MRTFARLCLCGALLAGSPCAGVPVASRQATGDTWDVETKAPKLPCEKIRNELAFPIAASEREAAIAMLQRSSVRAVDNEIASELLQQGDKANLFASLLAAQVTQLQARRNAAFAIQKGNWSEADTVTTSDLVALAGPHYPPYRPYLVRGLTAELASRAGFVIHLCGKILLVDNLSGGASARRSPLIVFLQVSPARALPSWYR